jgi:hypothetical protein
LRSRRQYGISRGESVSCRCGCRATSALTLATLHCLLCLLCLLCSESFMSWREATALSLTCRSTCPKGSRPSSNSSYCSASRAAAEAVAAAAVRRELRVLLFGSRFPWQSDLQRQLHHACDSCVTVGVVFTLGQAKQAKQHRARLALAEFV